MRILVTNDDGIDSPGIYALAHALRKIGEVIVVAPDRQQSAVGHALTVSSPLRATPFHRDGAMFGYAIDGTPTDCVKMAISTLLPEKPDIIVSGINHGTNTSINVLYSGTVSAATEGMMMGIRSMAVSLTSFDHAADMSIAAEYACAVAKQLPTLELPSDTILNVNVPTVPRDVIKGIKITRLSKSMWNDHYERRIDPMGHDYFWINGQYITLDDDITDSDDMALKDNYVSITPIHYDLTNRAVMKRITLLEEIIL
ncbi:MAG: 5'/3'-nucleotidase SurE [Ignavibacteriae bacterium]|nr:5'/3'-nucleotidase SurE [Ignavibacteriota bacterium]